MARDTDKRQRVQEAIGRVIPIRKGLAFGLLAAEPSSSPETVDGESLAVLAGFGVLPCDPSLARLQNVKRLLALADLALELLPCPVSGDTSSVRLLRGDQERVVPRVVVKAGLHIEELPERVGRSYLVNGLGQRV